VLEVSTRDARTIQDLKRAVVEGKNWYRALLEAIHLWRSSEEDYEGRHYRYLVDNEAFDWLVLAERLCEELDGLVPEQEQIALLFRDTPPAGSPGSEFRTMIGPAKYRAHLNYFYGILVERFLVLAVTDEVRKERRVVGLSNDNGVSDEAYLRIYGSGQPALLKQFRRERRYPLARSIPLSELNEFTYWLFKHRVKTRDKSCVASDTKKALTKLYETMRLKGKPVCCAAPEA
jgi:hypothetical protein